MSDYQLFIKYGDKVYIDVFMIGEIIISFDELQKNRYLKHYYDLSLMLTNNKHIVFQKSKYKNVEPFIYREDRFWGFDSAFIDANHKKIDKIVEHLYKVVSNEQPYYYKINPYDLENMEYTSQEVLTNFHKNNAERKCDKFWGGNFELTYDIYNNLVIDYNNKRSWQKSIGYVPQNIYLSDDTVSANIAIGVEPAHIDYAEVCRSAKIANIHDFIINELAEGYNTIVGERGVRLSGGQRQRIGIARAMYHKPQLFIFDEATSALDSITENTVMEAVKKLGKKITIIIIAHRLSTVRDCEKIFLLEKGKLIDEGTFETLVKTNKNFSSLVKKQ
jgi:ABC-type dipeptide/oligopeptide/nickel transport system ATPase subunit